MVAIFDCFAEQKCCFQPELWLLKDIIVSLQDLIKLKN